MSNTPLIAICGPGRSGKDVASAIFAEVFGVPYTKSTSQAAIDLVWDLWGRENYHRRNDMFADRSNHRETWAKIIWRYNAPDGTRLYRDMIDEGETILCGIRKATELAACKAAGIVDLSVWIDRPGCEDVTCELKPDDCDVVIFNHGTLSEFTASTRRAAEWCKGGNGGISYPLSGIHGVHQAFFGDVFDNCDNRPILTKQP